MSRNDDGTIMVESRDERQRHRDELLVAAGRKPHVADLGLESVGLPGDVHLHVDEHMRVEGHPWLYAVGDVNGRTLLTHMGKHQARIAADNVLGHDITCTKADGPLSPRVMFTEPQVAAVGHTLASAREQGLDVRAVDHPVGAVAGGSFYGKGAEGLVRIVVDEDRQVLAGATFTGVDVADFLHAATIAFVGEVPLDRCMRRFRPSRRAARSGCGCSRSTGSERATQPSSSSSCALDLDVGLARRESRAGSTMAS